MERENISFLLFVTKIKRYAQSLNLTACNIVSIWKGGNIENYLQMPAVKQKFKLCLQSNQKPHNISQFSFEESKPCENIYIKFIYCLGIASTS